MKIHWGSLAVGFTIGWIAMKCADPAAASAQGIRTLPLGTVSHLAHEAAIRHNLPQWQADRIVCLAWNEATFRPEATNGQYAGLMQFGPNLWWSYAPQLGYTEDLRTDPAAAIDVAAFVGSRGGWSNWQPVWDGRC